MPKPIVLASGSSIRSALLKQAGIQFEVVKPNLDEQSVKAALTAVGEPPRNIADALAEAKALKGQGKRPEALVIGSDQVLVFDGQLRSKCQTQEEAVALLTEMQGKEHRQISAAAIAEDGKVVWRHIEEVRLLMRPLTEDFIADYIAQNWTDVRHSVGCYHLESEGVRLFARVSGDYFSALGFPLLAVQSFLATRGDIAA